MEVPSGRMMRKTRFALMPEYEPSRAAIVSVLAPSSQVKRMRDHPPFSHAYVSKSSS